jgi:hypothetical protein
MLKRMCAYWLGECRNPAVSIRHGSATVVTGA